MIHWSLLVFILANISVSAVMYYAFKDDWYFSSDNISSLIGLIIVITIFELICINFGRYTVLTDVIK